MFSNVIKSNLLLFMGFPVGKATIPVGAFLGYYLFRLMRGNTIDSVQTFIAATGWALGATAVVYAVDTEEGGKYKDYDPLYGYGSDTGGMKPKPKPTPAPAPKNNDKKAPAKKTPSQPVSMFTAMY